MNNLDFLTPGKLTTDKSKKENRAFDATWTDSFAFTADDAG